MNGRLAEDSARQPGSRKPRRLDTRRDQPVARDADPSFRIPQRVRPIDRLRHGKTPEVRGHVQRCLRHHLRLMEKRIEKLACNALGRFLQTRSGPLG